MLTICEPDRKLSDNRRNFTWRQPERTPTLARSREVPALSAKIPVVLTIKTANARVVYAAGTFNDWRPTLTPLRSIGNNAWQVELFLDPGEYHYHFVIDGQSLNDPAATQFVANDFGDLNSMMLVG